MKEVISPNLLISLSFAKYAKWACNISRESFEMLLRAIDVFGTLYITAADNSGRYPLVECSVQCEPHVRLIRALEELAIIRKTLKARNYLELQETVSDAKKSAYSDEFNRYLQNGDSGINWAAIFSEYQLYLLCWYVGEYACRVRPNYDEAEDDDLFSFSGVPTVSQKMMNDALKTIATVYWSGG